VDEDVYVAYNSPEEGVLFWGGPWHNKVVPQDQNTMNRGVVKVPMPVRAKAYKTEIDYSEPIDAITPTISYTVKRVVSPTYPNRTVEVWYVLICMDREEALIRHLNETVKFLLSLIPPRLVDPLQAFI
jgi:hypothetical protein